MTDANDIAKTTETIEIRHWLHGMTFEAAINYWKGQGDRNPLSGPLLAYIKAAVEIKGWKL